MPRNPDSPAKRWARPIVLVVILLVAGVAFWSWRRAGGGDEAAVAGENAELQETLEPWEQPASRPVPEEPPDEPAARPAVGAPPAGAARQAAERAEAARGEEEQKRVPVPIVEEDDTLNRPGPAPGPAVSREVVREQMELLRPAIRGCYEDLLEEFPEAEGKLTIAFDIGAEAGRGYVELARLDPEATTLFDARLHDCVLESMGELEFEADGPDGVMHVTYPFHFRDGAGAGGAAGEEEP